MRTRIFFPVNNTDFLSCPELSNYRILSSHGISRTVTDFLFLFLSRIIEFSNFNHTEYHGRSRISFFFLFLSRIIELSNFVFTRNITDSHGFLFFLFLSQIIEFQSHGISRTVTGFLFFCPEFSRLVLGPTDRREVIFEFLSSVILRDSPCD